MARTLSPAPATRPQAALQPKAHAKDETEERPKRRGVPGRPKSPTEAVAKAIYFRDRKMVEELESMLSDHPRASLSGLIQQLLAEFVTSYKAQPPVDNKLTISSISIYL